MLTIDVAVRLKFRLKKRQVKSIRKFAEVMKWPNLGETLEQLEMRDEESSLDIVSSDAFAYFSGLVVPGVRFLGTRTPKRIKLTKSCSQHCPFSR